ncbi:MAG: hypothetical protein ACK4EY_16295 [Flavipsychrobacter sp.]
MKKAIDITSRILFIGLLTVYVIVIERNSRRTISMECINKHRIQHIIEPDTYYVIYRKGNLFYSPKISAVDYNKATIGKHYKVKIWQVIAD